LKTVALIQINDQWKDMPLWINSDFFTYSNQKLKEELGINLTDFKKRIEDTIDYYNNLGWPAPQYGISEIKRQELIEKSKQNPTTPNLH
jgi:GTP-dependent phosphoenolpyruvate carboxykinase